MERLYLEEILLGTYDTYLASRQEKQEVTLTLLLTLPYSVWENFTEWEAIRDCVSATFKHTDGFLSMKNHSKSLN